MAKKSRVTEDGEVIQLADEMIQGNEYRPFFKTPYNHNTEDESLRTATYCLDKTLTQQNFAEEAEINNIMRKFGATGQLPVPEMPPVYQYLGDRLDMPGMIALVERGHETFMQLPAEQRALFNNDMGRYVNEVNKAIERNDKEFLAKLKLSPEISDPPPSPQGDSSANGGDKPAK